MVYKFGHMCHHIVRRASKVFDPPPFTGENKRFRSAVGQKFFFLVIFNNP